MKEKLKFFIYYHGFKTGIAMICLPIITDLIWHGGREFNLVSVGNMGVICQVIGVVLMISGGRNSK